MRDRRSRVLAFFTIVAAVAIFLGSSIFFWNALPPTSGLLGSPIAWSPPTDGPAELPSALAPASLAGVRVAVLEDSENERVTPAGFYSAEIGRWKDLLRRHGATLAPISSADVLVLPHALCASVSLRLLVARHLERGGGIVTTGLTGAMDGRCRPVADTLLIDLVGGEHGAVRPLQSDSGSYYAVVLGETALGVGIPPGARIEIRRSHQIAFTGAGREVFYSDYLREPAPAPGDTTAVAAALRSRVGEGRAVALGFALSELVPGWSDEVGSAMVANGVAWAAGRPLAHVASWPGGAGAAVVLAQDVEQQFDNAGRVADLLRRDRVPATFFLLGTDADDHARTARHVAGAVEVGTHTVTHEDLRGKPIEWQLRQLAWAQRELQRQVGHRALGLRPPEEKFDLTTLKAWSSLGGTYVFGANNLRTAAPEIVPLQRDSIVLLARSGVDDYYLLATEELRDRGQILGRMLAEVDNAVDDRGLYVASFHSHLLGSPELLDVLDSFVRVVRARGDVWFASAGDVARWWRQRYDIHVDPDSAGSHVRVLNTGTRPLQGALVLVDLPDGRRGFARPGILEPGRPVTVQVWAAR